MEKIDFKKSMDSYKAKHNEFRIIEIPEMQYLMIDGHGDPNTSEEYKVAVAALYPVAYKLKFYSKRELNKDYVVSPLEGLWWSKDMQNFTTNRDKSSWDWTMMIMVPEWITNEIFDIVKAKITDVKSVEKVRLEILNEGLCVQTLHIGSYDDEAPVLEKMHNQFIPGNKLKMVKKHHEIYLSDPRKVSPDKLKTILRQPVAKR